MTAAAPGYFRRLGRRLTDDLDSLDAEEMAETARADGAHQVAEVSVGEEVVLCGRLRSVEACSKATEAGVRAEFFDGTGTVVLIWIGRRRIPGILPGRNLVVRGRIGDRDGDKVIYNPYYELRS